MGQIQKVFKHQNNERFFFLCALECVLFNIIFQSKKKKKDYRTFLQWFTEDIH